MNYKSVIMRGALLVICLCAAAAIGLTGCGFYVPEVHEVWEGQDALVFELNVKKHIYCELQQAIERVSGNSVDAVKFDNEDALPDSWGVQVSLSFQIDETGELDPGVSLISPRPNMQSYSTILGGKLSSQAERIDKYEFYYPIGPLKKSLVGSGNSDCSTPSNSSLLSSASNLKIYEWLRGALLVDKVDPSAPIPSTSGSAFKPDVLSYETKFIVISSGNVTPQWKLIKISANTAGTFFNVNRTRTHDLILTFGPTQKPGKPGVPAKAGGPREPSVIAANAALASEIGSSVASKIAARIGN